MRSQSVPEVSRWAWLTTADVARMLQVTPRGVRWLARAGRLPAERTVSDRQWLFRFGDVERLLRQRAAARVQSRHARLQAVRPRMVQARLVPHQLRLRLLVDTAAGGETSLPHPEVKRANLFEIDHGSDKRRFR